MLNQREKTFLKFGERLAKITGNEFDRDWPPVRGAQGKRSPFATSSQGLIYLILLAGIGIPALLRAAVERVLLSGLVFLPDFCRFTGLFNQF